MVAAGTGITVLPCTSVLHGQGNESLISIMPFAPPQPSRTVALAWRKHFPREQAIQTIVDTVKACQLPGVQAIAEN